MPPNIDMLEADTARIEKALEADIARIPALPAGRRAHPLLSKNAAFTTLELLLVVAILGIGSTIVMRMTPILIRKNQAARVMADFRATREAFRLWMTDTQLFWYPKEDAYASGTPPFSCENEPPLTNTDLFSDVSGRSGWSGPYLSKTPLTPWGREYLYDNDDDTYDFTSAKKRKGVNFRLAWCNAADGTAHRDMVKYIDEAMDQGDGSETGLVRWSTGSTGVINILLSPDENAQ